MVTEPYMGLKIWNNLTDPYDHAQLADNWAKVAQHDHSGGKGLQIGSGGILDGAITASKLSAALTTTPSDASVTMAKLASDVIANYEPAFATYKVIHTVSAYHTSTISGSGTWLITPALSTNTLTNLLGSNIFYFDPARYVAGARTTKLNLEAVVVVGATAPAITLTFGVYPITSIGAGNVNLGAVQSGSTIAFASPGANSLNQNVSGDFNAPGSAGYYGIAVAASGASAASPTVQMVGRIGLRQI